MRVMGNLSKKVMVAIMSASMAMTPAIGALAVPMAIETFVAAPSNEEATKMLEQFVAANFPGRRIAVKVKARLYKAGMPVNECGVLRQSYGIGNAYDGQNVEVVQIHKDGMITVTTVPVVNGKVSFDVTDMGTFFIVI